MFKFLTFFALFVSTLSANAQNLPWPSNLKCSPYESAKAFLKNMDEESDKNSQFKHRSFVGNLGEYLFELNGGDNIEFHIPCTRLILGENDHIAADMGYIRVSSDGCKVINFSGGSAHSVSE